MPSAWDSVILKPKAKVPLDSILEVEGDGFVYPSKITLLIFLILQMKKTNATGESKVTES